jgi:hypothetical protein
MTTTGIPLGSGSGERSQRWSLQIVSPSPAAQRQHSCPPSPFRGGSASTGGSSSRSRSSPAKGNVTHSSTGGRRNASRARSKSCSGVSVTELRPTL